MKKILFSILVLCSSIAMSRAQELTNLTRFEGERITGLDVGGAWEIELTQGEVNKAVFSFPKRFENQLVTSLEEGKLKIYFRGDINSKSGDKLVVQVVCSSLSEIELSGACKLKADGKFDSHDLDLELGGAAYVQFSGEIVIANRLKIDNSGASKMFATVKASSMDIELSGAAAINLSGAAETAKVEVSGAAKLNMQNLEARRINLDVSGAAKLNLNVTERISGEISGAAKVIYTGTALADVDVSGAGNLKHDGKKTTVD